jgi:hypothetical protein
MPTAIDDFVMVMGREGRVISTVENGGIVGYTMLDAGVGCSCCGVPGASVGKNATII